MFRSPVEKGLEKRLSERRRAEARDRKRQAFLARERGRRAAYWGRSRHRAVFAEALEDACGALWASLWRRGA